MRLSTSPSATLKVVSFASLYPHAYSLRYPVTDVEQIAVLEKMWHDVKHDIQSLRAGVTTNAGESSNRWV